MKPFLPIFLLLLLLVSCNKEDWEYDFIGTFRNYRTFTGRINANDNSSIIDRDENVFICGNNQDFVSILKISKRGKKIWQKDYSTWDNPKANALVQAANGDLFICGETLRNYADRRSDILLLKTNSQGDTLWAKTYGGESFDIGKCIITTSDGNLLIAAKTESFGAGSYGDIYLVKVNLNGDTLWTRSYADPAEQFPTHLMETKDGNYLVTGNNWESGMDQTPESYLLKVDRAGKKIWDRKYGPNDWMWSYSSVELTNGEILTCGQITEDGYSQVLLLRADPEGNYYRVKKYGDPKLTETGYSIRKNRDNSFTIAGTSYDASNGLSEVIAFKIDEFGIEQWFKRFGEAKFSDGLNLIKTPGNDNIITGNYNDKIFLTVLTDGGKFD